MKIRTLLVGFSLLLAGCAAVHPAVLSRAFSDDLEEARKLVKTGHLKQAVDDLSMLIDMDPKNTEARFLRGSAYQGLDEFERAVKDYEAIVTTNPNVAKAHYNLGMIYAYKLKDPRHALEHFDRFLSIEPHHDRAFAVAKVMCSIDVTRRGSALEDQGLPDLLREAADLKDPGERRKKFLEAAKLNPGSPVPLYLLGKAYEEEGKEEEAIKAYKQAIEVRPTCAPCHESLGKLLISKKKVEEGRKHLAKAELFDPNQSHSNLETPTDQTEEERNNGGSTL